jgi:hypothetical protein
VELHGDDFYLAFLLCEANANVYSRKGLMIQGIAPFMGDNKHFGHTEINHMAQL